MVSFSCEACGDVVKKPKLDSHKSQCGTDAYTCLDCNQTFSGGAYRAHNSCITEKEKYEGGAAKTKKSKKVKIETPAEALAAIPEPFGAADFVSLDAEVAEPPAKKPKKEKKIKTEAKPEMNGEVNGFHIDTVPEPPAMMETAPASNGMLMHVNADRAQQLAMPSEAAPSYIALDTGDGTKREKGKGKKRKRDEEEVEDELPDLDPTQIPLVTLHGRPRTPAEIKKQARAQRSKEAREKREDRKKKREEKAARRKLEKREHIGRLQKERDPDSPLARLYKFVALTTNDAARPMALNEIMPMTIAKLQADLGGDAEEYEELFMSEVKILSQKGRMRFKMLSAFSPLGAIS